MFKQPVQNLLFMFENAWLYVACLQFYDSGERHQPNERKSNVSNRHHSNHNRASNWNYLTNSYCNEQRKIRKRKQIPTKQSAWDAQANEHNGREAVLMTEDKELKSKHALAQSRAKTRLVQMYKSEYETIYRQECEKLGLTNRLPKAERIAKLKAQLQRLEASV